MTVWDDYRGLDFERHGDGLMVVTIVGSGPMNSLDERSHWELARLWRDVGDDPSVRTVVVTGAPGAFCAGGTLAMERRIAGDHVAVRETMRDARDLVLNLINCDKPVVSAINGPAAGAGLVVALLADISLIAEDTKFTDGHIRIGVAAGDHAVLVWPLLCGMARAKYWLLTGGSLSGREAADIGLVSKAVPADDLKHEAMAIGRELAVGPQSAIRSTKRSLNHWLRMFAPAFEASLGLEMLDLLGRDFPEGLDAFEAKRSPTFRYDEAWDAPPGSPEPST